MNFKFTIITRILFSLLIVKPAQGTFSDDFCLKFAQESHLAYQAFYQCSEIIAVEYQDEEVQDPFICNYQLKDGSFLFLDVGNQLLAANFHNNMDIGGGIALLKEERSKVFPKNRKRSVGLRSLELGEHHTIIEYLISPKRSLNPWSKQNRLNLNVQMKCEYTEQYGPLQES